MNIKLYEILTANNIVESINNNIDYLLSLIPEIRYMIGFKHNHPHHHLDVWNHTLLALSLSENNFEIRLVLLLHDIGKPFSYQDEEIRHFHNHANVSSNMAKTILTRLNYPENFINKICYLIKYHDTPITNKDILENYELTYELYKIQYCDALAHNPTKLSKRKEYLNNTLKLLKK